MVDYIQPDDPYRPKNDKLKVFSAGRIALQCHDEQSKVYFKSIQVRPLPKAAKSELLVTKEWDNKITKMRGVALRCWRALGANNASSLDQTESSAHNAWPTQRSIARCVEIFIVLKLSHPL